MWGVSSVRPLRAFDASLCLMGRKRTSILCGSPSSFESGGEADVPGLTCHHATGACCLDGSAHDGAAVVGTSCEQWASLHRSLCASGSDFSKTCCCTLCVAFDRRDTRAIGAKVL